MAVARRKAAQATNTGHGDGRHDALALLAESHNATAKLSREFERRRKAADTVEKGKLALRICRELDIQAALKREVFYPAALAVLDDDGRRMVDRLLVEHDAIRRLIVKVRNMAADEPTFDASLEVLADQAGRSMEREEAELFPELRHSGLDLQGVGERMASRRTQLSTAPADRSTIRRARKVLGGS